MTEAQAHLEGAQGKPLTKKRSPGKLGRLGLGMITGAADDDPSAIGTYAAAGAKFGPSFLWVAPVTLPMMYSVVYLSAKLGQVTGQGLFGVIRERYPKIVYPVVLGNIFEAGADIGGMAAALNLLIPISFKVTVVVIALVIVAVQIWGSYKLISNIFRWLFVLLFAYIGSALLAKPDAVAVLKGTFLPSIHFDKEFMAMLVAVVGTTLSAYLYSWKSNEEVEEKIEAGLVSRSERKGTSDEVLKKTKTDVWIGMVFSNVITYFIILSTAATPFKVGHHDVNSAAEAAKSLEPFAGKAAGVLFAVGIIGVGFLAVPVMTTGAAYDAAQTFKWKAGLHRKAGHANEFHLAILVFTVAAVAMNFLNLNPMKVLVWAGIIQGFSTPPLMLLIMLLTNDKKIMGERVNKRGINILGWITTAAIFSASAGLVATLVM
jgi:NRAMP (natural resistance-associated macrophage protein)-like metal ion transporter